MIFSVVGYWAVPLGVVGCVMAALWSRRLARLWCSEAEESVTALSAGGVPSPQLDAYARMPSGAIAFAGLSLVVFVDGLRGTFLSSEVPWARKDSLGDSALVALEVFGAVVASLALLTAVTTAAWRWPRFLIFPWLRGASKPGPVAGD